MVIPTAYFEIKASKSKRFKCTLNKLECALNCIYRLFTIYICKAFGFINPNVSKYELFICSFRSIEDNKYLIKGKHSFASNFF